MVNADQKALDQFNNDERLELLKNVFNVYKNNNMDGKLDSPKLYDQLITDLTQQKFDRKFHLSVDAQVKAEQQDLAKKMTDEIKEVLAKVSSQDCDVKISAKVGVGDQMAPIKDANKVFEDKGEDVITHKEGEVILYDLWATWCPPCQRPMAHNQEMLTKKTNWAGKVRIVGLSIDNSVPTVKAHVEKNKWTSVEHYHVRNGKCNASETYGSGGVPHVWLVDTKGKIVFMGHPATRNLEEDIDALLQGKTITGEGTGASAASKAEGGKAKENVTSAIEQFEKQASEFIKNDDVKKAVGDGVHRGFCVVVDTVTYDGADFKHDAVCHTQLIGKQAAIDKLQTLCKQINQGPWENKDMIRPA